MGTCKIAPGIYCYTAVDDCSRYRVLDVIKRRTAANTLAFIDKVIEEMPLLIQRVQTDRGTEFFTEKVQLKLMEHGIKFRTKNNEAEYIIIRMGLITRHKKTDFKSVYCYLFHW
jgi:putative transposase